MKKILIFFVFILMLNTVSAEEIFNETFLFSEAGSIVGYGAAGSNLYGAASVSPYVVQEGRINFDNIKILTYIKFHAKTITNSGARTSKITVLDKMSRFVPFTSTINGIYYGSGSIGWEKTNNIETSEYYYYIIFDNVDTEYANSLSGIKVLDFSYNTEVYTNYSYSATGGLDRTSFRSTPSRVDLYVSIPFGSFSLASFENSAMNTGYMVSDEATLIFDNTTQTYGYVNVTKNNVQYRVSVSDESGFEYTNQTNTVDFSDIFHKANGIVAKITHTLTGQSVTRTLWSTLPQPSDEPTSAIISLETTTLATSDSLNYSIQWQQYNPSDYYLIYINNPDKNIRTAIAASSTTQLNSSSYQLSDIYTGTNYLSLYSFQRDETIAVSQNFSVFAGSTLLDSIYTSKTEYTFGELVNVYGNASALSRVIITPYDGQQILRQYPVTGAYSIELILDTGRYFALLQRQPDYCPNPSGCWSTVVATQFAVGSSGTLHIEWIDPEGDNNDFTTIGTFINVKYSNVTANDTVEITYPGGTFLQWTAPQYPGSRGFYIPDTQNSIGIWTAKITNGSNATDYVSDTISVGKKGRYSEDSTGTGLYADLDIVGETCTGIETTLSWNTNLTQYYITVTTASKRVMEDNYTTSYGQKTLVFNQPGTYYIRVIDSNLITWAEKTIVVTNCAIAPQPGMTADISDPGSFIVDDIVGSSWFWAALIIVFLAVAAGSIAGTGGLIAGGGIGIVMTSVGGLIPAWALFLFAVMIIGMLSFILGGKMGGDS